MDKNLCSFCKAELSEGERTCHVCGADVSASVSAEKRICASCGAKLNDTQKFCYKCGTEWVAPQPKGAVCSECGAPVPTDADFCGECGARLTVDDTNVIIAPVEDGAPATVFADNLPNEVKTALNIEDTPTRAEKKHIFTVLELVKRSLVLLIALLVFGLAFAPVSEMEMDLGPELQQIVDDIDIKLTALDLVCIPFDAAKSVEAEDIPDLELYEELEEMAKDLEYAILYEEELEDYDRLIYLTVRLMLQSDEVDTSASMIFGAVTAALYLVLSALFLVFAAVWFAALFRGSDALGGAALGLLAAAPIYTIAFLVSNAISGMRNSMALDEVEVSVNVSPAPVLSIVLAFAVLAFVAVLRIFFEERPPVRVGSIIKRSLACALSLVLILLPLAPVFNTTVKTKFNGKDKATEASTSLGAEFFTSLEISKKEIEERDDKDESSVRYDVNNYYEAIANESKRTYESGESAANTLLAKELLVGYGGYEYASVFSLGMICYALITMCAAALLWVNLVAVATGYGPKRYVTIPIKALAVGFAIGALVLAIVICSVITTNVGEFKNMNYSFKLNGGIITTLVFAVLTAGAPMVWKPRKSEEFEA
jgi:ribosomal protein L40E